jgi:hypothetical protein
MQSEFDSESLRVALAVSMLIPSAIRPHMRPLQIQEIFNIIEYSSKLDWWTENGNPLIPHIVFRETVNKYINYVIAGDVDGRKKLVDNFAPPNGGYGRATQFRITQWTLQLIIMLEPDDVMRRWLKSRHQERQESHVPREE